MRLFQRCVSLLQSAAEGGSQKALLTPLDCQADKLPAAVWARIIQQAMEGLKNKRGIDILARMIQVLPTTQSTQWLALS